MLTAQPWGHRVFKYFPNLYEKLPTEPQRRRWYMGLLYLPLLCMISAITIAYFNSFNPITLLGEEASDNTISAILSVIAVLLSFIVALIDLYILYKESFLKLTIHLLFLFALSGFITLIVCSLTDSAIPLLLAIVASAYVNRRCFPLLKRYLRFIGYGILQSVVSSLFQLGAAYAFVAGFSSVLQSLLSNSESIAYGWLILGDFFLAIAILTPAFIIHWMLHREQKNDLSTGRTLCIYVLVPLIICFALSAFLTCIPHRLFSFESLFGPQNSDPLAPPQPVADSEK